MNKHKEFTIAWVILVSIVLAGVVVGYVYFIKNDFDQTEKTGLIIFAVLSVLIVLNFYGLTVEISGDTIKVYFGFGLISKKIKFEKIEAVEAVTNPWYYGWGVRIISNGMMFNVTGTKAIEISYKNSSRVFRIGTKNPQRLVEEINSRIS
ncbi:hypothetical protein [Fulvivirga lutimaris]|uniref:hypothetical protein n=1 Tax=Fulvivirga lutimaris TaxID=1819566 RepID=UPI0012BCB38C|nr:hypothetical protein [Fulvivirga lutimaris]MTI39008.1 hypothetical protein [Fulvivirga lutimaris]